MFAYLCLHLCLCVCVCQNREQWYFGLSIIIIQIFIDVSICTYRQCLDHTRLLVPYVPSDSGSPVQDCFFDVTSHLHCHYRWRLRESHSPAQLVAARLGQVLNHEVLVLFLGLSCSILFAGVRSISWSSTEDSHGVTHTPGFLKRQLVRELLPSVKFSFLTSFTAVVVGKLHSQASPSAAGYRPLPEAWTGCPEAWGSSPFLRTTSSNGFAHGFSISSRSTEASHGVTHTRISWEASGSRAVAEC